jgi:hypothetical protein
MSTKPGDTDRRNDNSAPSSDIMRGSQVQTLKNLQQLKSSTSEAQLQSLKPESDGEMGRVGDGTAASSPSSKTNKFQIRNTSADGQGSKRGVAPAKAVVGAPSNYDKIKQLREIKSKDKGLRKLYMAPEPVCRTML